MSVFVRYSKSIWITYIAPSSVDIRDEKVLKPEPLDQEMNADIAALFAVVVSSEVGLRLPELHARA